MGQNMGQKCLGKIRIFFILGDNAFKRLTRSILSASKKGIFLILVDVSQKSLKKSIKSTSTDQQSTNKENPILLERTP